MAFVALSLLSVVVVAAVVGIPWVVTPWIVTPWFVTPWVVTPWFVTPWTVEVARPQQAERVGLIEVVGARLEAEFVVAVAAAVVELVAEGEGVAYPLRVDLVLGAASYPVEVEVAGLAVAAVVEKDQSLTWRPRRLHYWQPRLCSLHRPSFR